MKYIYINSSNSRHCGKVENVKEVALSLIGMCFEALEKLAVRLCIPCMVRSGYQIRVLFSDTSTCIPQVVPRKRGAKVEIFSKLMNRKAPRSVAVVGRLFKSA
jgi:hypothetical protein